MALPYVTTTQVQPVLEKVDKIKEELESSVGGKFPTYDIDFSNIDFSSDEEQIVLEDGTELHQAILDGTIIRGLNMHFYPETAPDMFVKCAILIPTATTSTGNLSVLNHFGFDIVVRYYGTITLPNETKDGTVEVPVCGDMSNLSFDSSESDTWILSLNLK